MGRRDPGKPTCRVPSDMGKAQAMTTDSLKPRPILIALALALAAELLFLANLTIPAKPVFDEVYYTEAARTIARLYGPYNVEHPLFAKTIMAGGVLLFGDNPLGWRFFSTVAGSAVVMGVFAIGWQIFGRVRPALYAAIFVLLNFTVFIQARIAMLDGFMAAFVLMAVSAMIAAARAPAEQTRRWLVLAAVLLGLAVGSKWTAIPYVAFAGLAMIALRLRGRERRYFAGISLAPGLAILGGVSIVTYFLTFAPAFFYQYEPLTLATLIPFQFRILTQQLAPLPIHPYQSVWWSWPLDLRPMWYLYEPVDGIQRGILLLGNPAVMWGGLIAVAACVYGGLRERATPMLAAALLWGGSYGMWVVVPKKIGFFYYYYLPSIFLGLALAAALERYAEPRFKYASEAALLITLALFAWFFPIISAAPLDNDQAFLRWTWFASWR